MHWERGWDGMGFGIRKQYNSTKRSNTTSLANLQRLLLFRSSGTINWRNLSLCTRRRRAVKLRLETAPFPQLTAGGHASGAAVLNLEQKGFYSPADSRGENFFLPHAATKKELCSSIDHTVALVLLSLSVSSPVRCKTDSLFPPPFSAGEKRGHWSLE